MNPLSWHAVIPVVTRATGRPRLLYLANCNIDGTNLGASCNTAARTCMKASMDRGCPDVEGPKSAGPTCLATLRQLPWPGSYSNGCARRQLGAGLAAGVCSSSKTTFDHDALIAHHINLSSHVRCAQHVMVLYRFAAVVNVGYCAWCCGLNPAHVISRLRLH